MAGLGVQFQPESPNHLEDRVKAGAAFPRKSFVEAFAGEPGVSGNLSHAFSAGNVTKRFGNEGGISIRFFQAGFKVSSHFLRGSKVFCNVIASGGGLGHSDYSERLRNRLDVAGISTGKTLDSGLDSRPCLDVAQGVEPLGENLGFPNFNHSATVAARLHIVNRDYAVERSRIPCQSTCAARPICSEAHA